MPENKTDSSAGRLESLDVLRVVATVAVVAIHVSAATLLNTPREALGYAVAGFLNQASRFAVPAFVLITGAGLFLTYGQRRDVSWLHYFRRRFQAIGVPYLLWSVAYFFFYRVVERDFTALIHGLLKALATASAVYTFYYFIIIVPFYLLFPLLRPLAHSRWLGPVTVLALALNGLIVWFGFPHVKFHLGPVLSRLWPYGGFTPLWWAGPFFLGAWLALRWESAGAWLRRCWAALMGLAAILLVWVLVEFQAYVSAGRLAYVATNFRPSAYTYGLAVMPAIIGLGEVLTGRSAGVRRAIRWLSRLSFGVYLVHPLVMSVARNILGLLDLGALEYLALNLLLVLALSYLASFILARLPLGGGLIGLGRR